jgi:hypothetical protein
MATKKKTPLKSAAQPATIIIPNQSIIVGTRSVSWDHPARNAILANIKAKNWAKVIEMMNPLKAVLSYGKGKLSVRVEDNEVIYKGSTIDGQLGKRLLEMMQNSMPIDYLLKFVDKARLNPSFRAQKELYGFLEYGQLPITADGNFLARKVVAKDFYDKHSHTVLYKPGTKVSMPRHKVDDNSANTCSSGLHVYSKDYSQGFASFGDKFLLVEIDPTNVVAVPPDYNCTKMRVCEMFVVKELTEENDPEFFGSLVYGNQTEQWS